MTQTMYDHILDLLQAEGVDTLFGIPDPSFFGMFIEAERRGMRIISPHHEQAAALTADGYFRMTGKPAVLCMNKGPGVAKQGVLGTLETLRFLQLLRAMAHQVRAYKRGYRVT